ncbi:MAG: cytochrome C oxidase subunit IV family protein [Acidobacteriota bacterium]|nr:cytochrome C oxidase subunit IV family protein [Acidobacteriota bacterium]
MADKHSSSRHDEHREHEPGHDHEHEHIGIPGYLGVFAVLFFGTIITYYVALVDLEWLFPGANTLVALLIAFFKMSCVILFFMHVRWMPRLIWLTALAGFFWLAIMFAFTMQDYLTRSVIGR